MNSLNVILLCLRGDRGARTVRPAGSLSLQLKGVGKLEAVRGSPAWGGALCFCCLSGFIISSEFEFVSDVMWEMGASASGWEPHPTHGAPIHSSLPWLP